MTPDVLIIGVFIFFTAVMVFGGLFALALERAYISRHPEWLEGTHHRPKWSKDLSIMPRHNDCKTCEIEVLKLEEAYARRDAARRS